jgi:phage shock protein PspC (stress-responsive transcriptional regulator)
MNTSATNPESSTEADAGIPAGTGATPGPAGAATGSAGNSTGSAGDSTGSGASSAGSATDAPHYEAPGYFGPGSALGSRELSRPVNDRMLAGVASGLARYLNVDVTLVRVILAVLVFVGGAGVPLYLAGWLLIPEEGAERSIASDLIGSLENRSR